MRGLYAVTAQSICEDERTLLDAVARAGPHAALLQYRDKRNPAPLRARLAAALAALCRELRLPLIVNDDVELARRIGAGVHLGQADAPLAEARARLGADAIIGVSCAGSLQRAHAAQSGGASYVAFGRFFESRTKPQAPQAGLEVLHEARQALHIPICAIGGITPDNAATLIDAGADLVAAVEGVFGAPDCGAAALAFRRLFEERAASRRTGN